MTVQSVVAHIRRRNDRIIESALCFRLITASVPVIAADRRRGIKNGVFWMIIELP
jgi:hypothetical protein